MDYNHDVTRHSWDVSIGTGQMYESDWDKVIDANDPDAAAGLSSTYSVRGSGRWGGCQEIQSKLSEHGFCRFTRWDPQPPFWSFMYDTDLTREQLFALLGPDKEKNQITII